MKNFADTDKETLDIVIPVYNEEDCLDELVARLDKVRKNFLRPPLHGVNCIFVNDGSSDLTSDKLESYADGFPWIKVIHLSRNFGHQLALTAGLDHSSADFVAVMDSDLQDPPELLPRMVERLKAGNDIVFGRRNRRPGETFFKRFSAKIFYRIVRMLCQVDIPEDTGDFRVMSKRVVRTIQNLRETHRFMRGLVPWTGFRSEAFRYDREKRHAGETKYPFGKMLSFALDAIFSFSYFPIRMATYIGLFLISAGAAGTSYVLYLKFNGDVIPGLATSLIAITVLGGVQILILGIIGEYIGRIFEETKKRPLYVVGKTRNLEESENARFRDSEERRRVP